MPNHNFTKATSKPAPKDYYRLEHPRGFSPMVLANGQAADGPYGEIAKVYKTSECRSELRVGSGATLSLQVIGSERILLLNFDDLHCPEPWCLRIESVTLKGVNPREDISDKEMFLWFRNGEEVGTSVVRYGQNALLSLEHFGTRFQPFIATALHMLYLKKHHELYEQLETFTTGPFGYYYTREVFPMNWEDHGNQTYELTRLEESLRYEELHTGQRRYQWIRRKWVPITNNLWPGFHPSNAHKDLWNFYHYGMNSVIPIPVLNRIWGDTWKELLSHDGRRKLELLESTVACIKELMYIGSWDLDSTFGWLNDRRGTGDLT
ncbi:hypothetical protein BKA70DRAFT_1234266 [Coprinopsis sp. MPI-PUGE-AT-0042]|nr:hypothetical protein BKA70DRAFT_1234266 [Coprinopsis sp. MPI-PUGE-AT-0042]